MFICDKSMPDSVRSKNYVYFGKRNVIFLKKKDSVNNRSKKQIF